jgi:hypothetical protein
MYYHTIKPLKKGTASWSESAVEYTIFFDGKEIKTAQCKDHLAEFYIQQDIKNHQLELLKKELLTINK